MGISLGGYHLKKMHEFQGRDFEGLEVDLYKGDTFIAHLRDAGDGGVVEVDFNPKLSDSQREQVLEDMRTLLSHLQPVLEEGGLWEDFCNTPYSAAEAFVNLLVELRDIAGSARKAERGTPEHLYYIVAQFGPSWFANEPAIGSSIVLSGKGVHSTFEEALTNFKREQPEYEKRFGKLRALAVLQGHMDWNLSFEKFADLFNP